MSTVTEIFARLERLVRPADGSAPRAAENTAQRTPSGRVAATGNAIGGGDPVRRPEWHELGGRVGWARRTERRG
jgi:hypothetical protein